MTKPTHIFTIQPRCVFDQIQEKGVYQPIRSEVFRPQDDWCDWTWQNAYAWMRDQLILRTGRGPAFDDHYPVWGWVSTDSNPFNTDLRRSLFRSWGAKSQEYALLELSLPLSEQLMSDYDYWHSALNYWFLASSETEDNSFSEKCKKQGIVRYASSVPYPEEIDREIKKSWEQIFDKKALINLASKWGDNYKDATWQTVFWEIRKESVKSVKFFKPRLPL